MTQLLFRISLVFIAILSVVGCNRIDNNPAGNETFVDTAAQPLPGCGIDSKELRAASDKMARSIFASPKIRNAQNPPKLVIDSKYFINDSTEIIDKAMFTDYLRVELQRASDGKFEIIGRIYSDMVEAERTAEKGGTVSSGNVDGSKKLTGWDYRLGGAIRSISKVAFKNGQRSSYFLITFELVERSTSKIVWSDRYEFKKISDTPSIYR